MIRVPVAHGDGNYFADAETLDRLEGEGRVAFRYVPGPDEPEARANPNGSIRAIAGITNEARQCPGPDAAPRRRHRRPPPHPGRRAAVRRHGRGAVVSAAKRCVLPPTLDLSLVGGRERAASPTSLPFPAPPWRGGSAVGGPRRSRDLAPIPHRSNAQPVGHMTPPQSRIRVTPNIVAEHGLTADEYAKILEIIGREPNLTELGIFSAMWNEHCSYKSSRIWLKTLPTTAPWVICGPGENAGVVDIGEGLAAVFKMESHNHPSFIEPHQGAATGVGGILRDVFTMGARPIANLNALRFGSSRPREDALSGGRRGRRHRQLRQLYRRADRGRRVHVPRQLQRQQPGQRHDRGPRAGRPHLLRRRRRDRRAGHLCRLQDRPRRHPRRQHGIRRVQRGHRGKTPDRAGRRSRSRKNCCWKPAWS